MVSLPVGLERVDGVFLIHQQHQCFFCSVEHLHLRHAGRRVIVHHPVLLHLAQHVLSNPVGRHVLHFRVQRRKPSQQLLVTALLQLLLLNSTVLALLLDFTPVHQQHAFISGVEVHDRPLRQVGALVGVNDVVEKLITDHCEQLGALNCLQLVGRPLEHPLLHKGKDRGKGLRFVGVVPAIESFFVGTEDLGEADWVAAQVVDEHVVGLALFADGSVVVLGAAEDVDVALAFEEMVVVSALEAVPAVAVPLHALSDVQSAGHCQ